MTTARLTDAAAEILARGRITFADVRRLQRDLLPNGVSNREEAEILIQLDRQTTQSARSWADFFVVTLVDYVVWSERPTGIVNEEAASWLSDALDQPTQTRTARRLIAAIVSEAERVHERLAVDEQPDVPLAA
jgi:hypothetical protein